MIIYLYGPDSYRRGKKLEELVCAYRAKYSLADFAQFDVREDPEGWVEARDFLGQLSMFVGSKLAVVRESGSVTLGGWREVLRSEVHSKKTFVIISDSSKPKKDFRFLLGDGIRSQEFGVLEGNKLGAFLEREAGERGISFSQDAWEFLLLYVGSFKEERSWVAVSALEQVSLARFPKPVSLEDLRKVIVWEKTNDAFPLALRLLGALGERRLVALESMFSQGYTPSHMFNLLCAVAKKREDVFSLASADEQIKSGELDDEAALTLFAL